VSLPCSTVSCGPAVCHCCAFWLTTEPPTGPPSPAPTDGLAPRGGRTVASRASLLVDRGHRQHLEIAAQRL
jgi:hypothetical protein